ncbi:hypothetical protein EI982_16530 [Haloplanus rallus]|jgi:uncharacterized Zn finger protein (UPF0148 family)|uniref:TFIIB-type zinc ribbon-containing protein n=1 Tax=Haloplanus rallus TaxID=1816183 RepID=A0A6B9FGL5_9EURY|nr:hypothetical protein [Haloplanus rallus]QGX96269.1 hypothetical protein EI982_16530 [Haloplanus rallus]
MKVRGRRECQDCGCRWSYYETGSVACPDCESLRSVGVDDRSLHTDSPATLDLTPYRTAAAEGRLDDVVDDCKRDLRTYVRRRGFVDGGQLRPLDETLVAAAELLQVVDAFDRLRSPTDADHAYVLALLRDADGGGRPGPSAVTDALAPARGLGDANAADAYRDDLLAWLDEHPDSEARRALGTLRERIKRIEALQGDVSPSDAESLVTAAREIGTYLREDDETALAAARDRLRYSSD